MFCTARARTLMVAMSYALVCVPVVARAQTCLGYPDFATGPTNISLDGVVGGRFWGTGANVNLGHATGGAFGDLSVGSTSFIDPPKETRFSYGAMIGDERHTHDQLIWCPLATFTMEQGQTVNLGSGRHSRTAGYLLGGGLGLSGELPGRGSLSINPFVAAVFESRHTAVSGDSTDKIDEAGVSFSAGLGIRFKDAVQITPMFTGATFEGSDLVFSLRVSLSLQFRKK